jgi:type III secretory pathway lipoprotein EscJ
MNDTPESSDRRRIGAAETDIQVLKTTAQTTTELLAGVAVNQKATVTALDALRLAQYPPFQDILKIFSLGVALMASVLAAFYFLTDSRIDETTKLLEYRVQQLERAIVLTPGFAPAKP